MKVAKNKIERHDSWLTDFAFSSEEEYATTRFDSFFIHEVDGVNFPYYSLVLIMDETVTTSERSVKTILVALSNTGGIMGFFIISIGYTI